MSNYEHPSTHTQKPEQTGATGAKVAMGCGMGCLTVILGSVLALVAVYWFAQSRVNEFARQHSSEDPVEFVYPEIQLHELEAIILRFDTFRDKMANQGDADPLVLTGDEMNIIINNHPDFSAVAGKTLFQIEGDEFSAQVSLKPDEIPFDIPFLSKGFKGRYINGTAKLSLNITGARSELYLNDFVFGEVEIPAQFMDALRNENLMNNLKNDPSIGKWFKMIGMKVENGRLHIIPKKKLIEDAEKERLKNQENPGGDKLATSYPSNCFATFS